MGKIDISKVPVKTGSAYPAPYAEWIRESFETCVRFAVEIDRVSG